MGQPFQSFLQIPDLLLLLLCWERDNLETDDPSSYRSTGRERGRINCLWLSRELFSAVPTYRDTLWALMLRLSVLLWLPCRAQHAPQGLLLSGCTAASQAHSLEFCRSHSRKELGLLCGKWMLNKPPLFFLLIFKRRAPRRHFIS